jgi:hypothetical protein
MKARLTWLTAAKNQAADQNLIKVGFTQPAPVQIRLRIINYCITVRLAITVSNRRKFVCKNMSSLTLKITH